jgi:hypothetical protein
MLQVSYRASADVAAAARALTAVGACCLLLSAAAGQSVVNVYINKDKNFAFVEFRTGGEGAACRVVQVQGSGGVAIV